MTEAVPATSSSMRLDAPAFVPQASKEALFTPTATELGGGGRMPPHLQQLDDVDALLAAAGGAAAYAPPMSPLSAGVPPAALLPHLLQAGYPHYLALHQQQLAAAAAAVAAGTPQHATNVAHALGLFDVSGASPQQGEAAAHDGATSWPPTPGATGHGQLPPSSPYGAVTVAGTGLQLLATAAPRTAPPQTAPPQTVAPPTAPQAQTPERDVSGISADPLKLLWTPSTAVPDDSPPPSSPPPSAEAASAELQDVQEPEEPHGEALADSFEGCRALLLQMRASLGPTRPPPLGALTAQRVPPGANNHHSAEEKVAMQSPQRGTPSAGAGAWSPAPASPPPPLSVAATPPPRQQHRREAPPALPTDGASAGQLLLDMVRGTATEDQGAAILQLIQGGGQAQAPQQQQQQQAAKPGRGGAKAANNGWNGGTSTKENGGRNGGWKQQSWDEPAHNGSTPSKSAAGGRGERQPQAQNKARAAIRQAAAEARGGATKGNGGSRRKS